MFTDKEAHYEKQRLKMFWTTRWTYQNLEKWRVVLCGEDMAFSRRSQKRAFEKAYNIMITDALMKLIFEKRLTKDEGSSLLDMLNADDKESIFLALTIMQQKKPKIFLKG
jgi:hypothetical protein